MDGLKRGRVVVWSCRLEDIGERKYRAAIPNFLACKCMSEMKRKEEDDDIPAYKIEILNDGIDSGLCIGSTSPTSCGSEDYLTSRAML
jgi:hypothetical protein